MGCQHPGANRDLRPYGESGWQRMLSFMFSQAGIDLYSHDFRPELHGTMMVLP